MVSKIAYELYYENKLNRLINIRIYSSYNKTFKKYSTYFLVKTLEKDKINDKLTNFTSNMQYLLLFWI